MNISGFGSAVTELSAAKAKNAVSLSVLDMSMDMNMEAGDSLIKMMEQSVNPSIGANFDIKL